LSRRLSLKYAGTGRKADAREYARAALADAGRHVEDYFCTPNFSRKGRQGAKNAKGKKGLLYVKIIVIFQDSSCSTKIKRTTTPLSSLGVLCASA